MAKVVSVLTLTGIVLMSGCLGLNGPNRGTEGPGSASRLADLEKCEFSTLEGRLVDCHDRTSRLDQESMPSVMGGWVCVDDAPFSDTVRLWYHPVRDELGIELNTPESTSSVFSYLADQENVPMYRWSKTRPTSFTTILHPPPNGDLQVRVYRTWTETETPLLHGATLDELWSLADGQEPYPISVMRTPTASYYFSAAVKFERGSGVYSYEMVNSTFQGEDYAFKFRYWKILNAGLEYSTTSIQPSGCGTDLG